MNLTLREAVDAGVREGLCQSIWQMCSDLDCPACTRARWHQKPWWRRIWLDEPPLPPYNQLMDRFIGEIVKERANVE
ncbi:gp53 [Alphaproteobacteria phage PhiJL001]|uniref:Gp53 n=1 Tax=Alphaproteobacteria phage PhiJL001 TaxID=2681607 RepID=Q5DN52_9CAUD|nr:gp53 [Alphaproteobacteria phage PhiJL001]AAT69529.1 gp53 [Alphaproteobacteria phage PhiJL001]